MAILELLVRQAYVGQEVINRFHYISTGEPASVSRSFALTSAFGLIPDTGVYPPLAPFAYWVTMVNPSLTFIEAQVRNLYSATDFYTRPWVPAYPGTRTGVPASPALSLGMFSNRITLAVRRGYKRIAGLTEDDMGAGGVVESATLSGLAELATRFSNVLEYDDEGTPITFTPAVLAFNEYTTPSGKKAYKPYPTEVEQLAHAAVGVSYSPYSEVRTQTSRQYGRGR